MLVYQRVTHKVIHLWTKNNAITCHRPSVGTLFHDLRAVSEFSNVPGPPIVLEMARLKKRGAHDRCSGHSFGYTKRPGSRVDIEVPPEVEWFPSPKDWNPWETPSTFRSSLTVLTHIHSLHQEFIRGIGNIWSLPATVQSLKFLLLWQTASDFPTRKINGTWNNFSALFGCWLIGGWTISLQWTINSSGSFLAMKLKPL